MAGLILGTTSCLQSVPYVVALCSRMLLIYYARLPKPMQSFSSPSTRLDASSRQPTSPTIYLIYATKKARVFCIQIFVLLNVVAFAAILLLTRLAFTGPDRVTVLGWLCVGFSVLCLFAAPLSIIARYTHKECRVHAILFYLSVFLTLNAIAWFGYDFFTKDLYVELPNVLGFVFGVAQMVVYIVYKKKKKNKKDAAVAELSSVPASELQVSLEEKDQNKRSMEDGQDTDKKDAWSCLQ